MLINGIDVDEEVFSAEAQVCIYMYVCKYLYGDKY
jgi:hypothetical protein